MDAFDNQAGSTGVASGTSTFGLVIAIEAHRLEHGRSQTIASAWRDCRASSLPAGQDPDTSLTDRLMLCDQVRTAIQAVSPEVRRRVLDALAAWSGQPPPPPWSGRPMTPDELRTLAHGGTIEIGAHTMSHPWLPGLDPASQRVEVANARTHLEAAIGAPVTSFSYPSATPATRATRWARWLRPPGSFEVARASDA